VLRFNGVTGAFIDVFVSSERDEAWADIAFGPDGHLYVCNPTTGSILRFHGATGAFIDVFVSKLTSPLGNPRFLIFGSNGSLYVSSDSRVLRYDAATGAYLHTITAPKLKSAFGMALVEMDFPWPYYAEWQFVPRYLWAIIIGFILGAWAARPSTLGAAVSRVTSGGINNSGAGSA
jgi:hypothetical protein